jgi:WD repeat-containing protein 48
VQKTAVQQLLSSPIKPPTSSDAPLNLFPSNTIVLISEEASPSYTTVYRGTVSTTHNDIDALEKGIPLWLAEYLLLNQTPPFSAPLTKLSFTLLPWNKDPDVEPLPELLNAYVTLFCFFISS